MPSRRQERINGRIVKEVSEIIRTLKDPEVGFVTVTKCSVSPDLRHAQVFVSVLGDQNAQDSTMAILNKTAGYINRELGKNLGMKYTPHLEFVYDESIANAANISRLIDEARANDPDHVHKEISENEEGDDSE